MNTSNEPEQKSILKAIGLGLQHVMILFGFPAPDPSMAINKKLPKWQRVTIALLTVIGVLLVGVYIVLLNKTTK